MTARESGEAPASEPEQAATHLPAANPDQLTTEELRDLATGHPEACGCLYCAEIRQRDERAAEARHRRIADEVRRVVGL